VSAEPLSTVLVPSMVGVVLAVVLGRWLTRLTRVGDVMRRLEDIQVAVTAWQLDHRGRVRRLERKMTDVEISVSCAGEEAHAAGVQMRSMNRDLIRRMEEVEPRLEILVLVEQGRIPREHLS
jgi:hypothetical protein